MPRKTERPRGLTLRDLAGRLGCRLAGNPRIRVYRVAALDEAETGDLAFFSNPRFLPALRVTRASAVLLHDDAPSPPCATLRSADPHLALVAAIELLNPSPVPPPAGVDPRASVHPDAHLGRDVAVGPFVAVAAGARIGDRTVIYPHASVGRGAVVGKDCLIHSHASLREYVRLGDRVVIQDGARIGSDGFHFVTRPDGRQLKIPQHGGVHLEDDVEVGANCVIERSAVGQTRIGTGTKIGTLSVIGHRANIGRDGLLASGAAVAGGTRVGDGATFGGQVGVAGYIRLGDRVRAAGRSGIAHSLPDDADVAGAPALERGQWLRAVTAFARLPELRSALASLERRLARLESTAPAGGTAEPAP